MKKCLYVLLLTLLLCLPVTIISAEPQEAVRREEAEGKTVFLGDSGQRLTEWILFQGETYYVDPVTSVLKKGWRTINGKRYYFWKDGRMYKDGWMFMKTAGTRHYLRKDGSAAVGSYVINGKYYYFQKRYGTMLTGWRYANNHQYYYGKNGVRRHGLQKIDGALFYLNTKWGYAQKGWKTVEGKKYYFKADYTGTTGLRKIGGRLYIFDSNGVLQTSHPVYKFNGRYYRIDSSGEAVQFKKEADVLACKKLETLGYDLRSAFNWAVSIPHKDTPQTVPADYTKTQYFGEFGFKNGYGDCYVKACVFYRMAGILGYKVRFVQGYVPSRKGGMTTHGWVEILYNGAWYVCDPSFTSHTGRNGFMISYGTSGTWRYMNYAVSETNET